MGIIYTYAEPHTGRVRYVGKTDRKLSKRIAEHKYGAKKGKKSHLYCWLRSIGTEPLVEVLDEGPNTNELECYWIEQLKFWGFDLVNHTKGGEGVVGWHHSEKTKNYFSVLFKGRRNPNIQNVIAAAQKANRGRKKPTSRKTVLIAIEASKSREARIARSRAHGGFSVFCHQNLQTYATASEAACALKIDSSAISKNLQGKLRSVKGFTFQRSNLDIETESFQKWPKV